MKKIALLMFSITVSNIGLLFAKIEVQGHDYMPENSVFIQALEEGADVVELDLPKQSRMIRIGYNF